MHCKKYEISDKYCSLKYENSREIKRIAFNAEKIDTMTLIFKTEFLYGAQWLQVNSSFLSLVHFTSSMF